MDESKKPKKKLDIAKILADPEKAIADLLSSPEIMNKIPEALVKLPDEAKKSLATELFKYLPAAAPASETPQMTIDYQVLAAEVIKQMPQPEPGPTVKEIAVEAARLVQFPAIEDIAKELAKVVPHPVEDELVSKVTAKVAIQTTERFNKLEIQITELVKTINTGQATAIAWLENNKTAMCKEIAEQLADNHKSQPTGEGAGPPLTGKTAVATAEGPEDGDSAAKRRSAGTLGTVATIAEPFLALGEKYPQMAELIIDKIFNRTPQTAGVPGELSRYYRWHQIFTDMEKGNVKAGIEQIIKQTDSQADQQTGQQPGT